ncbi:GroES-like protein [Epithele typhae]|uniref:GroES-like protein n=1 Tax=Epithele typhae TaxID=378194 RepID=UPI002007A102|nr:GroES-like protein [Epithele typhae]KAH9921185.1 GroES-like protein [Epithele typhae]
MAPKTQKALVVPALKAPWELRTGYPVPVPGLDEVRVQVMATSLNPADWKIQKNGMPFVKTYPFIGGLDAAGIVDEVGENVKNVAKGDRIMCAGGWEPKYAAFQEYFLHPADLVVKIPDNLSFDEATTIPLVLATVAVPMWSKSQMGHLGMPAPWHEGGDQYRGKPALVTAGASSVGQLAIQLARMQGFSPIITTCSPKHAEYLESLGATHTLDRALPEAAALAAVRAATGGAGVAFAYDVVGARPTTRLCYVALADGGVAALMAPSLECIEDLKREGDGKRTARPFGSFQLPGARELGLEVVARLPGWLADGTVRPTRVEVLPGGLSGIPEGLERMVRNEVSGVKLVVHPHETA